MAWHDDADDEHGAPRPPLPPDDRLWRHPSELGAHGSGTLGSPAAPALRSRPAVAVGAALAGAVVAGLVLTVSGAVPTRTVERAVVEKVAVSPVLSSPMLQQHQGVAALADRLGPAVVRLEVRRDGGEAIGSGVVFRDDGLVLTSAHLLTGSHRVDAVLSSGRRVAARVVGLDPLTEVALVDLEGDGHPVAVLGTSTELAVGSPALVLGAAPSPNGSATVTTGVVSALSQPARTVDGGWLHGLVQIDAPIAVHAAGAAVVDERGAVVGIATRYATDADGDFGYATPIDVARRVAADLDALGRARHAWLGVAGQDLTSAELVELGLGHGARVAEAVEGGPAAAAGLVAGDVVTHLDGEPIDSMTSLVVALRDRAPGERVVVRWQRGAGQHQAEVVLAERP